jgi:HEAT repeat protein
MAREISLLISLLISELNSSDAEVRSNAAEALSRLGDDARGAAVPLARCVGDDNEEVQEWVVAALDGLGPPSASDLAALIDLLAQDTPDVAYWAATLIGRLCERVVAAVSALCAALKEDRPNFVRERAAWALGRIGRTAGQMAVAALKKIDDDSQPRLARLARRALDQISH